MGLREREGGRGNNEREREGGGIKGEMGRLNPEENGIRSHLKNWKVKKKNHVT